MRIQISVNDSSALIAKHNKLKAEVLCGNPVMSNVFKNPLLVPELNPDMFSYK